MLEIRLNCENCDKPLPNDSSEAMICTYECTFCTECVEAILINVCPNCGGGFEKRPSRPKEQLVKHPPRKDKVQKPIQPDVFRKMFDKYKDINPRRR